VGWQKQYFELIPQFSPRFFHNLFQQANSSFLIFCPHSIVLPVFQNKPLSLLCARNYLHYECLEKLPPSDIEPLSAKIIFLSRNDSRRMRIKNISAIEDLVVSMGGHVVDPVDFSIFERIRLFSRPSVFIAESSGCMNFALFSHKSSRLISLVEPSGIQSVELLMGGHIYALGYAARTEYVIGSNLEPLAGSPLGSAEFSLSRIKQLIVANIATISSQV